MFEIINEIFKKTGINGEIGNLISYLVISLMTLFVFIIINFTSTKIILPVLRKITNKSKTKIDDILFQTGFFNNILRIISLFFLYLFTGFYPKSDKMIIERVLNSILSLFIIITLSGLLYSVEEIYKSYSKKSLGIVKGYTSLIKLFVWLIGGMITLSIAVNKSPLFLLSGIGAMTAVLMLIFKDTLLGFVGWIQLSMNNMLKIGDWIEMPKYGADGDVIEITVHTVKVRNWDNTVTTIPTYSCITDSFKNWRNMFESGGRRIKRSLYIDMTSVKFCDKAMREKLKTMRFLRGYIEQREKEIEDYNDSLGIGKDDMINGRWLTNLGIFRKYVNLYLENNNNINHNLITMVRYLQPTELGLPLELYVFTSDTRWTIYEEIQSDIFDHLIAVIPEFDLRIFQNPSGGDFRKLL